MNETTTIQSEVADAGGCRRRLTITIPPDLVAMEFDETLVRLSHAVRIPGFRKGKVPPEIIRMKFSRDLQEEVREHLVQEALGEAIAQHQLKPLHAPIIDGGDVKQGEPYSFTALFEVRPELRLGDHKGLAVTLAEPTVTDEDVDKMIEGIRERQGRFVPVEPRPVNPGDFVVADLEGHFEDDKGADFKHESVLIEVNPESNLPEFGGNLPGMSPGETKTFPVTYPENYEAPHLAGKQVRYTVLVKEIKAKELPALDDELPKDLGREGTLAEFREEIRRDLLAARKRAAERDAKETLLRGLIEANEVEVPEVMVEEQVNYQIEEIIQRMIMRGMNPETASVDWKELKEKELPLARKRVLGTLILDEIARRETLAVTDAEIDERIVAEARSRGEKPADVRKHLEEGSAKQAFKNQILREKSLDILLKNARITT